MNRKDQSGRAVICVLAWDDQETDRVRGLDLVYKDSGEVVTKFYARECEHGVTLRLNVARSLGFEVQDWRGDLPATLPEQELDRLIDQQERLLIRDAREQGYLSDLGRSYEMA